MPSHKRKGLVVSAGCAPAWVCKLITGWGMDMEDGIPALIPALTPPVAIPGPAYPIGAIPARGTIVAG